MSPLLRLWVSGGLAYCSYAMCRLPLLPLYARALGATPQMVGLVVGERRPGALRAGDPMGLAPRSAAR